MEHVSGTIPNGPKSIFLEDLQNVRFCPPVHAKLKPWLSCAAPPNLHAEKVTRIAHLEDLVTCLVLVMACYGDPQTKGGLNYAS